MEKIESVRFHPLVQRQEDPNWTFAGGHYPTIDGYIVTVTTSSGIVGHGYAETATHMGYSNAGIESALNIFQPLVVGRNVFDIESIMLDVEASLVGNSPAKAGIDCALHDAVAKARNAPLHDLFGGRVREKIVQTRILPIKSAVEMATMAQGLVEKGYRYLKIKLMGNPALDSERVAAIRSAVGPDIRLTLDANQSYSPKGAIGVLNRMAKWDIDLVEQPVHARNLAGLALVTRSVPMLVEADEAAISVHDILHLVAEQIVDVVSLKIGKLGGLRNTMLAARICERGGIACRMGATFGPQLYVAQGLHVAAALANLDLPCELAEFDHIFDDPYEGLHILDGAIAVPEGAGSGVTLRSESKIAAA